MTTTTNDKNVLARRIDFDRLSEFSNQIVRLIGRVKSIENNNLILEPNDGCHVNVVNFPTTSLKSKYIEVFGKVLDSTTLQFNNLFIELGDTLDLKLVNDSIRLTFHPELKNYYEPF